MMAAFTLPRTVAAPEPGRPGSPGTSGNPGTPEATNAAVAVSNLTHRYGGGARPALDSATFTVNRGEAFGVLGPNGGGKTTLFRILATMLAASDGGSAAILGHDVARDPAGVRARIGVVFQQPSLDAQLTARENLAHQGRLYGLGGRDLRDRISDTLQRFDLLDCADQYAGVLSGGMRRRLEIGKAMLHDPPLLLLDEPSTGLDPGARRDLSRHLQRLRETRGVTVLLTTHLMDEADRCDRIALFAQGRCVALDTPARLKAAVGGHVITVVPAHDGCVAALAQRLGAWSPRLVGDRLHIETRDAGAIAAIVQAGGAEAASVTVGQPTLEDAFLHLTGHTFWGEG